MLFVMVWPLIIIGIVIAVTRITTQQRRRAEAQKRAEQVQEEQPVTEGQASYTPVKPSVQIPSARKAQTAPKSTPTVQNAYRSPFAQPLQKHPEPDMCALQPEEPKKNTAPHEHAAIPALQSSGANLNLTPDNIVRGVLFSEIFGKPKALR